MSKPVIVYPYRAYFHYEPDSSFCWHYIIKHVCEPPPDWGQYNRSNFCMTLRGAKSEAKRTMRRMLKAQAMNERAERHNG